MAGRIRQSSLQQHAAALYAAATAFIRIYQFRDRDQALKSGLTVVQAYTLDLLLSSHGASLTGLARGLQLDKSTTSRVNRGLPGRGQGRWAAQGAHRR